MNDELRQQIAAVTAAEEERTELFPFSQLLRVVLHRIWTVVLVFVLVFTAVAVFTFRQQPEYEATTTIVIDLSLPQVLGKDVQRVEDLSTRDVWQSEDYFQTQYEIINSRSLAEKVVERYGLADNLVFLQLDKVEDPEELREALKKRDPVKMVMRSIEVRPAKKSRVVGIVATHPDPETAVLLSTGVAEVYEQQQVDRRLETTYGAYNWLAKQHRDVKEQLKRSEQALYKYKQDNDMLSTSLEDRQNMVSQALLDLNKRLTDVRTQRIKTQLLADQIRRSREDEIARESFTEVLDNPLIQNLKRIRADLARQDADMYQFLEKHPERARIREKIRQIDEEIDAEINKIHDTTENNLALLRRTEVALEGELEKVKEEAKLIEEKQLRYTELKREKETNERLHALVINRLKETDLSRLMRESNVRILDRPEVPKRPVRPVIWLNLLVGVALGMASGVVGAFVRDSIDNTIRNQEDVENITKQPFLGVIPTFTSDGQPNAGPDPETTEDSSELYANDYPKSSLAECCRTIRTNLMFMTPDRPLSRLLVTSAGPREGKTFSSVNLAIIIAQSNSRVLVIDTDMRRPRMHKVFGVHNDAGLTSLILGEVQPEDVIRPTRVPNLDLLSCGPIPPNPVELLHTDRFQEVVAQLDDRYDFLVFDSPPITPVADSMVLSRLVDGVVFVVRSKVTVRAVAQQAVARLTGVNATVLGCVMNAVNLQDRQSGYYYSYYHRYSRYYQEDPAEAEI